MTVVNPKSISGINSITTGSGSDDILTIHTNNGTERLRVDSTGTTKIVTGIVTTLTATTGIVTTLTANTVTSLGDVSIADKIVHTGDTNTAIRFSGADTITAETGGSERFRINSSGNVIIGDTDTDNAVTDSDNLVVGSASGDNGMTIVSQSGNYNGSIRFSDGANSGADAYRGTIQYYHGGNYMRFYTDATERLRITSAGEVVINDTSAVASSLFGIKVNPSTHNGIGFKPTSNGSFGALRTLNAAGSEVCNIQYDTTNANINFRTSNTQKATITSDGKIGINQTSPAHKLHVEDGSSGVIVAKQTTNNGGYNIFEGDASDGTTKFYVTHNGRVGAADGIIFGTDTATANILDDYEEGTYSPTPTGSSGSTNVSFYSNQDTLSYQKVGNTVTVHGRVRIENNNFSGYFRITLPFTPSQGSEGNNTGQAFVATHGVDFDSSAGTGSHMALTIEIVPNDVNAAFLITRDNANWITADYTHIKANSYLAFQLIYRTDS